MSFLPYGSGSGGWIMAHGGSAVVHGAVLALCFGGLQSLIGLAPTLPETSPAFTITLERLDSDTIAGLIEQDGEAGAENAEGTDPAAPDTPEETPSEEVAALLPQEVDDPPPAAPEPTELAPETPDAITPETVAPTAIKPETVAPVTATPVAPLPEQVSPIAPQTLTALPIEPVAPSVGQGTPGTAITPLEDEAAQITPVSPEAETLQPTQPGGEQIAAIGRPTDTPQPPRPAPPAPSAQDLAIGDLLRRIRTAPPQDCLLALPRRDGEDGVGLALISNSDNAMTRFVDDVLTAQDADIRQTRTLVDERQCAALSYIRDNVDYPATRLGIRLDSAEIPSGERLTGVLRGTAGRYVYLLLIDNNGVVQDLQRFTSFSGNFARFDVPVNRAGPPRDTKHLLLAIATRRPDTVIRDRAGRLAQDVFAGLDGEVAGNAALAVTTFDVR